MQNPLLEIFRSCSLFMRSIAGLVLVAFFGLITYPTVAAAQAEYQRMQLEAASAPKTAEEEFSKTILEIEEKVEKLKSKLASGQKEGSERDELKSLHKRVLELDKAILEHFADIEKDLRQKGLPAEILQRHHEAVAAYRKELDTLLANLEAIETAKTAPELKEQTEKAAKHLESRKLKRAQQPFDPNEMPHKRLEPKKENTPKVRKEDFKQAGLFSNPFPRLAALGDFSFDALPGANDPAYLAETVEVTLSQRIKDQAAALNHDPVEIYHWVLNNVEWIPSWGAVQDADLTLGSLRGNAMDIASLTVALLRASGIPARYVHGTVDVPEEKFRNWAGGFASIQAAGDFAASGGIPTTGIVSGGQVKTMRLEHVWVEAAIDYQPSRGLVNREADAWVEMDPSFKQYEYLQGLDVAAISGLDGEALAQDFLKSGTMNESEGWVQGFNGSILQNAQQQAETALENHIKGMTDPGVSDVIGGRKVIIQEFPGVPSSLPNAIVVDGARYAALPSALRPKLALGFGMDFFGYITNRVSFPWAAVNNHKVTLSFRPAAAADEAALESLLPEEEITDISQLPQSIPSYLIQVVPEIKVDGEIHLTGSAMPLGEDLNFAFEVTDPVLGTQSFPSPVVAGSYLSIAVVGGSVSPQALNDVQSRLEVTKSTLESEDHVLLASLDTEDLLGDAFHAGTLGYFAEYTASANLSARQQNSHFQLVPSVGTYGYVPNVNYFFGFPRSIQPGGVEMDLDRVAHAASVDGRGKEAAFSFTFQLGALSSVLEHAIPEQMFVTDDNPGEAVSAAKALQKAASAGQKVFHVTQENQSAALPQIHHSADTMDEIRRALAVGKEVITHTDPISVPGWTGAGYVIYDPDIGDGAWKIGGGTNGGYLKEKLQFLAGLWKWFSKAHPVIAKALTGSIGLILGTIAKIVDLMSNCKSLGAAIAVSLILLMWNIIFLGINVLLVSSGVGVAVLFLLSGLEWYLEKQFVDKVKTMC